MRYQLINNAFEEAIYLSVVKAVYHNKKVTVNYHNIMEKEFSTI